MPCGSHTGSSRHTRDAARARCITGRARARRAASPARRAASGSRPNDGASASAIGPARSGASSGIHSRMRCTRLPKSRPPPAPAAETTAGGAVRAGHPGGRDGNERAVATPSSMRALARGVPARGHRVPALGARTATRKSIAGSRSPRRGSVSASTTRTSASDAAGSGFTRSRQNEPVRASCGGARDHEQVARPRARHVQQPARLRPRPRLLLRDQLRPSPAAGSRARKPTAIVPLVPQRDRVGAAVEVVGGVVEDHDRRLQPLRLVDGQDAHGVAVARARGRAGPAPRARSRCAPRAGA